MDSSRRQGRDDSAARRLRDRTASFLQDRQRPRTCARRIRSNAVTRRLSARRTAAGSVPAGCMTRHAPRRGERAVELGAAPAVAALARVPHPPRVGDGHARDRRPELAHGQERWIADVADLDRARVVRRARRRLAGIRVAEQRQGHAEVGDVPVDRAQGLLVPEVEVAVEQVLGRGVPVALDEDAVGIDEVAEVLAARAVAGRVRPLAGGAIGHLRHRQQLVAERGQVRSAAPLRRRPARCRRGASRSDRRPGRARSAARRGRGRRCSAPSSRTRSGGRTGAARGRTRPEPARRRCCRADTRRQPRTPAALSR